MQKEEIKEKLLQTGLVYDCDALDMYCSIIYSNQETEKLKYQTQRHHIIPKKYFLLNHLEIDNSKLNIVNLLFKDHILAHFYLAEACVSGEFKYNMILAAYLLSGKLRKCEFEQLSDSQLCALQREYKKSREYIVEQARATNAGRKQSKEVISRRVATIKDKTKHKISELKSKLTMTWEEFCKSIISLNKNLQDIRKYCWQTFDASFDVVLAAFNKIVCTNTWICDII